MSIVRANSKPRTPRDLPRAETPQKSTWGEAWSPHRTPPDEVAALHALAEVFDGPLIGDVRCACGQRIVLGETYKRRAFRLRATGELACDGCAYRAAWKAVVA